jgi:hypothetical protein
MNTKRVWVASSVLMLLALVLMLVQHWGMTFTNSDDPWITQLGLQGSIDTAKTQGRFWLVPINLLAQLPYLIDSWAFANFIKMAVNGLVFISFVLFCSKLTNKHTGLLMGLVWLALIDINSSDFSPIHGFLLMFNLQFIFLFMSFYVFLDRLEKNDSAHIIVAPYLLFAFALLAYEPMFFYALVFPALYLYKQMQSPNPAANLSILKHAKIFLSRNYVLVAVLVLYVIFFFAFRKMYSANPRGLNSWSNTYDVLRTVFNFSVHGLHVQLKPFTGAVLEMNTPTNLFLAVLFSSSILAGMFLGIPRIDDSLTPSYLFKRKALVILGFFIFSPNILFGFVEGYREWAARDPHYVGNYFSSFPLAMAIALAVLYLVGGNKSKQEKALFILILYVFFSSACDNYLRWSQLAEINRNGSVIWQQGIRQLEQQTFDAHRQTLICGVNAPKRHLTGNDKYWSQYLSGKFAADILYDSNRVSRTACDVVLDFQKY